MTCFKAVLGDALGLQPSLSSGASLGSDALFDEFRGDNDTLEFVGDEPRSKLELSLASAVSDFDDARSVVSTRGDADISLELVDGLCLDAKWSIAVFDPCKTTDSGAGELLARESIVEAIGSKAEDLIE